MSEVSYKRRKKAKKEMMRKYGHNKRTSKRRKAANKYTGALGGKEA